jgi:hypothetical protein
MDKFAVFILSHGRADNVVTYKALKKFGYTGKIYIIIDDSDKTADRYYKNFGNEVIQFNKQHYIDLVDCADNFDDHRAVVYARNACFDIAKDLQLDYFLELDDDYKDFQYRYEEDGKLKLKYTNNLDSIFKACLKYLHSGLDALALAQGGDFIGGVGCAIHLERTKRKLMNAMFFKTNNVIKFVGKINEDVNTYTYYGSIGRKFLTIADMMVYQARTQEQAGGLTDIYLNFGTYTKSFYTIMIMPSCVKISMMGDTHLRLHHSINWDNCVPKIISDIYKKKQFNI